VNLEPMDYDPSRRFEAAAEVNDKKDGH